MEPEQNTTPSRRGNPNMRAGAPSVNPSGRPRGAAGLARYIAEQTAGGHELVDRLLAIVRSDNASTRDASAAVFALLDRLAGKPLQQSEIAAIARVEHIAALPAGWTALTLEQRRTFLDEVEKRRTIGAGATTALALVASNDDDEPDT
jgi:hypothetical protein